MFTSGNMCLSGKRISHKAVCQLTRADPGQEEEKEFFGPSKSNSSSNS